MPYFQWRGVDLAAETRRGLTFARSIEELDRHLFEEQAIALLSSKPARQRWRSGPIRLRYQVHCFRQLAVLTGTGVLLPEALIIVASQAQHPRLREVMHTIADEVASGELLSKVMARYHHLFSAIVVQLISVGEESGSLAGALDAVSSHLERTDDFYSRLRGALLLPIITLCFFAAIATVIFVLIIPYFADLFASMNHDLPFITRMLIGVSSFMRSWSVIGVLATGLVVFVCLALASRRPSGKCFVDALILRLPIVGDLLANRFMTYLLHATALLLEGGVPLAQALGIVGCSIDNIYLCTDVQGLEEAVNSGNALSTAMRDTSSRRFGDELVAMVRVGEESGRLAFILKKSAAARHDRLVHSLDRLMALLQPLLMVLLGLLIATLVFAVYGPIITMARII